MFENCTPAACGDLLALLALSIAVTAGLLAVVLALMSDWFKRGMEDIERADEAFWPEDSLR